MKPPTSRQLLRRYQLQTQLISVLIFFSLNLMFGPQSTDSSYVIFEDIGAMANSVNYINVKITVNLSSILDQHDHYVKALTELEASIEPIYTRQDDDTGKYYYEQNIKWLYNITYHQTLKVLNLHLKEAQEIKNKIIGLQQILPQAPPEEDHHIHKRTASFLPTDQSNAKYRGKRAVLPFIGVALGIYGTYMGWHNQQQIEYLLSERNKIIEVQQLHTTQILELGRNIDALTQYLSIQTALNPGLLDARLNRLERQIYQRVEASVHAIQQAQVRRLAIDLIPASQLTKLFAKLQKTAATQGCVLLLEHPSDLFQIEVSYFNDHGNVQLLLHVPMVSPDSTLRLFKLHPFPLPINSKAGPLLIPEVENNVLGITVGSQRHSVQLSAVDLLACFTVNRIYICDDSGVLRQDFTDTCLGSLYQQNLAAAKRICPLRVHPAEEMVKQLRNNWFAIYSPSALTVPVECRNGTSREMMTPAGISSFHLSEGCTATFKEHLVTSDYSVKAPTDFIHYEWKWDSTESLTDGLDPKTLTPQLETLASHGIHYPTLDAVQEMHIQANYSPGWWAHIVHFTGTSTLLLLFLMLVTFLIQRFRAHRHRQPQIVFPTPLEEAIAMESMVTHHYCEGPKPTARHKVKPSCASFPDDQ